MISKNRTAVITGASQGLGKAFAEACARRGWNLILAALPGSGLQTVAATVAEEHGVRVEALELDLTSDEGLSALIERAAAAEGPLDLLVNNVGTGLNGNFDAIPLDIQKKTVDLNVRSTMVLTHSLVPLLARHAPARILTVASLAGFYPMPMFAVYAASKAFLIHFSLALRHELEELGIGATALAPGGIYTNTATREKVRSQGWAGRLSSFEPDAVAELALAGALAGKALVVPGWFNRILMGLGSRAPKDAAARFILRRWRTALAKAGPIEDSAYLRRAL